MPCHCACIAQRQQPQQTSSKLKPAASSVPASQPLTHLPACTWIYLLVLVASKSIKVKTNKQQGVSVSNLHSTCLQPAPDQTTCTRLSVPLDSAQVIKILPNSKAWEHLQPQTAQQLGLHPRDVSLFTSDRKLTPQRATITVRDGMILFKTEAVRAIISADKALLITSRCGAITPKLAKKMLLPWFVMTVCVCCDMFTYSLWKIGQFMVQGTRQL